MKAAALSRPKRRRKVWTREESEAHGHLVSHGKSLIPAKRKIQTRQKQSVAMKRRQDSILEALRLSHGFGRLRPCKLECRLSPRHYEVVRFHAPREPARMTTAQADYLIALATSPRREEHEWLTVSFPDRETIAWHGVKTIRGGNKHWNTECIDPRRGWVNIAGHVVKAESRILKLQSPGGLRFVLVLVAPHREPRPYNPRPGSKPPGRPRKL
jgi:hypothetical protein